MRRRHWYTVHLDGTCTRHRYTGLIDGICTYAALIDGMRRPLRSWQNMNLLLPLAGGSTKQLCRYKYPNDVWIRHLGSRSTLEATLKALAESLSEKSGRPISRAGTGVWKRRVVKRVTMGQACGTGMWDRCVGQARGTGVWDRCVGQACWTGVRDRQACGIAPSPTMTGRLLHAPRAPFVQWDQRSCSNGNTRKRTDIKIVRRGSTSVTADACCTSIWTSRAQTALRLVLVGCSVTARAR